MLKVDAQGFDHMDRRLLLALLEKFDGGPVGVDSLAAAISEERDTIEDVLEPYLIQQGYMMRTPRGRTATKLAYRHFGLPDPSEDKWKNQLNNLLMVVINHINIRKRNSKIKEAWWSKNP